MKKLFALSLALALMVSAAALADVDLSGMTFDELVNLRAQVDAAIWASDGWQAVTVPPGIYQIGRDIPAGEWTITPANVDNYVTLSYDDERTATGVDEIDAEGVAMLIHPDSPNFSINPVGSVTWQLQDGWYLEVADNAVIFMPAVGPNLVFK